MVKLNVSLAERSYDIHIGSGAFALAVSELKILKQKGVKLVCIADSNVLQKHPLAVEQMKSVAEIISISGGEGSKCFAKFAEICSQLAQMNIDRKSVIVAWGGGVIGDLAGFVASAYMRGIKFYQIPTTLLAMVDSSVGGKTGINIPEGKNLVGAFHQPQGVFADIDFLATLPEREFSAGVAEVVKCGILGDEKLFVDIENLSEELSCKSSYLPEAICRCCALKAMVVAADERESASEGGRALLNLGHTFGHAIEKTAGYGKYLHGEAVAVGMVMASRLSKNLGFADCCERIKKLLQKCNLPVEINYEVSEENFIEAITHDKKNSGGNLRFVLIEEIGRSKTSNVAKENVVDVVKEFLAK